MAKLGVILILTAIAACLAGAPVSSGAALSAARDMLESMHVSQPLMPARELQTADQTVAWVYDLTPQGYLVIAADDDLPPVIAWSLTSSFTGPEGDLLAELLSADLIARLRYLPEPARASNRAAWQGLRQIRDPFQQWPPEGTTQTGGWLKTNWTQNGPYNAMCPMDNVTNIRSIAGCPAVAMAQIVNYHQTINGTAFSDADDYYHSYAGRNFWVDNDAAARDFPTWAELNGYLATMMTHYKLHQEQTDEDKAALVWACGAAMEQVYTSSGSGTFAVAQAFQGFQKFGFPEAELITDAAPDFYERMAQNIKDAEPVHLAVVTPAWDAGHNVVVDGYNTDGFFHLNFGWGGSYNGWYLLPSQIPYNLTVIEGAVLDIRPREYIFSVPDTLKWVTQADMGVWHELELINLSDAPLTIEGINGYPPYFGEGTLSVETYPVMLPHTLGSGQSLLVSVCWIFVDCMPRELASGNLEVVHQHGIHNVPLRMDPQFFYTELEENVQTPPRHLQACPNPFSGSLVIKGAQAQALELGIYNLKGKRVRVLRGGEELLWDGCDELGQRLPAGIYLLRSQGKSRGGFRKVIKLR